MLLLRRLVLKWIGLNDEITKPLSIVILKFLRDETALKSDEGAVFAR